MFNYNNNGGVGRLPQGGEAMTGANVTAKVFVVTAGITWTHFYNLVRAERLPGAFKENGEWKVPQAALNEYLKGRQRRMGSSTPRRNQTQVAA
jgi:hypothetical protein